MISKKVSNGIYKAICLDLFYQHLQLSVRHFQLITSGDNPICVLTECLPQHGVGRAGPQV